MAVVQWLGSKGAASSAASTATYVPVGNANVNFNTTESGVYTTIGTAGTWSNLYIRFYAYDRGNGTARSRVNGADGNQVVTITGTGEFEDTSNTDSVSVNDEINYSVTAGSGGSTAIFSLMSSLYSVSGAAVQVLHSTSGDSASLNGLTRYHALTGAWAADTSVNQTEAQTQYSARASHTLRNCCVNVRTNAKGGTSYVRSRVNGANGNIAVAITASTTGLFTDFSNSDSVVSGDEINWAVNHYADTNALRMWNVTGELVGTATTAMVASSSAAAAITVGTGVTQVFNSGSPVGSVTESYYTSETNHACTLSYLSAYVITNTTTANSTIRVRKNTANGNQLITVGAGATGYVEDASNTDSFALTDDFSYQIVAGSGGTSIILNSLANLWTDDSAGGGASGNPWFYYAQS